MKIELGTNEIIMLIKALRDKKEALMTLPTSTSSLQAKCEAQARYCDQIVSSLLRQAWEEIASQIASQEEDNDK